MKSYIYDGEYNSPMNEAAFDADIPNISEGKMVIFDKAEIQEEPLPFTDPPQPWECEREDEY